MSIRSVCFLAILSLTVGCSLPRPEASYTKVVNGIATAELRNVVELQALLSNGRTARCTGTVVRRHKVLTGAHCLEDPTNNDLPVRSVRLVDSEVNLSATKMTGHQDHLLIKDDMKKRRFDFGVLTFKEDLVEALNLAGIPTYRQTMVRPGETVFFVGFGHRRQHQSKPLYDAQRRVGCNVVKKVYGTVFETLGAMLKNNAYLRSPYFAHWQCNSSNQDQAYLGEYAAPAIGDSGGPIVDSAGRIAGLVVAGGLGYGYGTSPIHNPAAEFLYRQLGSRDAASIKLSPTDVFSHLVSRESKILAAKLGLILEQQGIGSRGYLYVQGIVAGSSASDSTIRANDALVEVNGQAIIGRDPWEVLSDVFDDLVVAKPATVNLKLARGRDVYQVSLTVPQS